MKREIPIGEVFTQEMIDQAKACSNTTEILERVIQPNMGHINTVTGQENDARFWAYAMEFALQQLKLGRTYH